MRERRRRDRGVGEAKQIAPPKRQRIYFFQGLDGIVVPMVEGSPDYNRPKQPRVAIKGFVLVNPYGERDDEWEGYSQ